MVKKIIWLFLFLFIFSILSSCNVKTTIYGEDIIAEEYIFGNFDYSYMKLKLLKNNDYEKVQFDSDNDGLYCEYYKVEVIINKMYLPDENVFIANDVNIKNYPNKQSLNEFNNSLSQNYYINVPLNLLECIKKVDEVIMRVYAPITGDYMIFPKVGESLGCLSSYYSLKEDAVKHNFYPIINGNVNIYTRDYDSKKYHKIYTNLDGFTYFDNSLKDRMSILEFENWMQSVYNNQKNDLEFICKNDETNDKMINLQEKIGEEDNEDYTDNKNLVYKDSALQRHSLLDGIDYGKYSIHLGPEHLYPTNSLTSYARLIINKEASYSETILNENGNEVSYKIVEVTFVEIYECIQNYEVKYLNPSNSIKEYYNSIEDYNKTLTKNYTILINSLDFDKLIFMDEIIINFKSILKNCDILNCLERTMPAEGSNLAIISLSNSHNYSFDFYDYFPIKNDNVYVWNRYYNNSSNNNIVTSLDIYHEYFYRGLYDIMTTSEFKNFLEVVQKRIDERLFDYTRVNQPHNIF